MGRGFNSNGELVPTVFDAKTGWNPAEDNWKVKRKSKVRMQNPAALMEGMAGLTLSVDKKNGVITIYDGHRVVMRVTQAQLDVALAKKKVEA